jgi:hypothetical protein
MASRTLADLREAALRMRVLKTQAAAALVNVSNFVNERLSRPPLHRGGVGKAVILCSGLRLLRLRNGAAKAVILCSVRRLAAAVVAVGPRCLAAGTVFRRFDRNRVCQQK